MIVSSYGRWGLAVDGDVVGKVRMRETR